jgi:hypothetical protein
MAGSAALSSPGKVGEHCAAETDLLSEIATQGVVTPNVRITCELWPARPWQPGVMVLPSMLLCQGRDGPARQVNAAVMPQPTGARSSSIP